VTDLPSLVYIQSGIPAVFEGDLSEPKEVLKWVLREAKATRVRSVSDIVLSRLIEKFDHLAAIFHTASNTSIAAVKALQPVAGRCREHGIAIVKLHDAEEVM